MNEPSILNSKEQRTRRNIAKMGAILGAVALAKVERARASGIVSILPPHHGMCLLRGTNIQTAAGQRKIEDLAIGDRLPTVFGGVRPMWDSRIWSAV